MNLNIQDLNWCLRRLPKKVRQLMEEEGNKVILAGGFVRSCIANEKINDVDLFTSSKEEAKRIALKLAGSEKLIYETENAYTVTRHFPFSVQVIHRWVFTNPVDVMQSFDFTIAQAAIWFDSVIRKYKSTCSDQFYMDLAAKRLIYTCPNRNEDAGGSILRVLKFYQRGYRIPIDSFGAVIARLVSAVEFHKIPTEYIATSSVQLEYRSRFVEKDIAKVLTGLLHEVDPLIDLDHIAHLPSTGEQIENSDLLY